VWHNGRYTRPNSVALLQRNLTNPNARHVGNGIERTRWQHPKPDAVVAGAFGGLSRQEMGRRKQKSKQR